MGKYFNIHSGPLYKVTLFWVALAAPLIVALLLAAPLFDKFTFCMNSQCYSTFLKEFELPLWVASLSLVFGVMVGRFHGSLQRHEGMKQAKENNSSTNYFNHREKFKAISNAEFYTVEIKRQVVGLVRDYDLKVDNNSLYSYFFPKNSYDNFNLEFLNVPFPTELQTAAKLISSEEYIRANPPKEVEDVIKYFKNNVGIEVSRSGGKTYELPVLFFLLEKFYRDCIYLSGSKGQATAIREMIPKDKDFVEVISIQPKDKNS